MWNGIIDQVTEGLPKFNNDLLLKFRKEKISGIDTHLDDVFKEIIKMFNGELEYVGYRTLSPKERIDHMTKDKIIRKKMEIQESSLKLLRFEFIFQEQIYHLHVYVPYLDPYAISLSGTKYYPQLPIVERGLHRVKNGILIKVMRAPLNFWKRDEHVFATTDGKSYREQILTVKIHQGGRRGKKTEKTPIVLYHLVAYGLYDTLYRYKFNDNDFVVTNIEMEEEGFKFIRVAPEIFFKVSLSCLKDRYKRRVIASILVTVKSHKKFTLNNIIDPAARYFKVVLGKYNQPYHTKDGILFGQAEKHLQSNESLLDIIAQRQLSHVGIHATNLNELLFEAFYNLDVWLLNYTPNDLYAKRIGALDQMVEGLIRGIVTTAFSITNNKQGLTQRTIIRLMKSTSKQRWFANSTMLRSSPQLFNDNWLLGIGAKRFRSIDNPDAKPYQKTKGKTLPVELIRAHPSQVVVESVMALPSSNPCVAGTISPFIQTDDYGNIVKPDYAEQIDNVFD